MTMSTPSSPAMGAGAVTFALSLALSIVAAAFPAKGRACGVYTASRVDIGLVSDYFQTFYVKDRSNPQMIEKERSFSCLNGNPKEAVLIQIRMDMDRAVDHADRNPTCFMKVLVGREYRDDVSGSVVSAYQNVDGTLRFDKGRTHIWTSTRSLHDYVQGDYRKEIVLKFSNGSKIRCQQQNPTTGRPVSAEKTEMRKAVNSFEPIYNYTVRMPERWKYHHKRNIVVRVCNNGFRKSAHGVKLALMFPHSRYLSTRFVGLPVLSPLRCYTKHLSVAFRNVTRRTRSFLVTGGLNEASVGYHNRVCKRDTGYVRCMPRSHIRYYREFRVHHR